MPPMAAPETAPLPCAGLRYVSWEITRRCDARCVHCYAESGPEAATDRDLSTAEALALIDQLAAAGEMILAFSGGEPLVRPDWRALMRRAVERELIVTLVTNGSLVDDRAADDLAALGLQSVTVSLDSHRPDVHDRIRRLDGLHARALGAIRRLGGRGVRVVVNFTPIRDNRDDARGVVELAYQLGAAAVTLSDYAPAGRGTPAMGLAEAERARLGAVSKRFASLTRREMEVLAEVVRGRMNKQIAATLGISERTVKMHRTAITTKVGVHSAAQLATLAREAALFGPDVPGP